VFTFSFDFSFALYAFNPAKTMARSLDEAGICLASLHSACCSLAGYLLSIVCCKEKNFSYMTLLNVMIKIWKVGGARLCFLWRSFLLFAIALVGVGIGDAGVLLYKGRVAISGV